MNDDFRKNQSNANGCSNNTDNVWNNLFHHFFKIEFHLALLEYFW